jgi:hypothetical protein
VSALKTVRLSAFGRDGGEYRKLRIFPAHVRYSGVALAYNVSFTAFSGTAPVVATELISATGSSPALFMAVCTALTLLGGL